MAHAEIIEYVVSYKPLLRKTTTFPSRFYMGDETKDVKHSLRNRFEQFMVTIPGVEGIDDLLAGQPSENDDRADYIADNHGLVIELKTIESDTEWKVSKILEPHREREDFPIFFGAWPVSKVLDHLPDGKEINARIVQAVTTSVRALFRKANNQVRATKTRFKLPEAQGLLIILNERVEILTPETLWSTLRKIAHSKLESGDFRYTEIRAVLVLSEAHGKELPGNVLGHPSLIMPFENGKPFAHDAFVNELTSSWARFNNADLVESDKKLTSFADLDFETMSKLMKSRRVTMPRYEAWTKYYNWNPYLRKFDDEYLKWLYGILMYEIGKGMFKGGTKDDADRAKYFWMEVFTHFMEEVSHRGIDIRFFTSDERSWRELDRLMASRFPNDPPPDRSWVERWKKGLRERKI